MAGTGRLAQAVGARSPMLGSHREGIVGEEHAYSPSHGSEASTLVGRLHSSQHEAPPGAGSRGSQPATDHLVLWPWAVLLPLRASVSKSEHCLGSYPTSSRSSPPSGPLHMLSQPPGMFFSKASSFSSCRTQLHCHLGNAISDRPIQYNPMSPFIRCLYTWFTYLRNSP